MKEEEIIHSATCEYCGRKSEKAERIIRMTVNAYLHVEKEFSDWRDLLSRFERKKTLWERIFE